MCRAWRFQPNTAVNAVDISTITGFPKAVQRFDLVETWKFVFDVAIVITLKIKWRALNLGEALKRR